MIIAPNVFSGGLAALPVGGIEDAQRATKHRSGSAQLGIAEPRLELVPVLVEPVSERVKQSAPGGS